MLCMPFLPFPIVRSDSFFLIQLVRTLPSGAAVRAMRQFEQFGPIGEAEHRTRNAASRFSSIGLSVEYRRVQMDVSCSRPIAEETRGNGEKQF